MQCSSRYYEHFFFGVSYARIAASKKRNVRVSHFARLFHCLLSVYSPRTPPPPPLPPSPLVRARLFFYVFVVLNTGAYNVVGICLMVLYVIWLDHTSQGLVVWLVQGGSPLAEFMPFKLLGDIIVGGDAVEIPGAYA